MWSKNRMITSNALLLSCVVRQKQNLWDESRNEYFLLKIILFLFIWKMMGDTYTQRKKEKERERR